MAGAAAGRAGGGRLPQLGGLAPHDRQRRIAIKCMELEEMLESQGYGLTSLGYVKLSLIHAELGVT